MTYRVKIICSSIIRTYMRTCGTQFHFLLDHVNYRTKQSNSMASYSGSGESLDTVVIPCITCKSIALD